MDAQSIATSAVNAASTVGGAVSDAVQSKFAENASQALVRIIDTVTSGIDSATSFLAAQIPDVIHQLLVYEFAASLGLCLSGLVGIVALPFAFRWLFQVTKEYVPERHRYEFDRANYAVVLFVILCFFEILPVTIFSTHFDWIKIWLAPKIYLIQYATDLVKVATGHGD